VPVDRDEEIDHLFIKLMEVKCFTSRMQYRDGMVMGGLPPSSACPMACGPGQSLYLGRQELFHSPFR